MEDGEMGRNRVQDVCQKFQILEDQTVAHELQEEEIHQHLSANRLKNQRARRNLWVARRLQEEEIKRSRQLSEKLCKHAGDCGDESTGSDDTRTIQEVGDWEEDEKDRRRASGEVDRRLRRWVRETGQHRDAGRMESVPGHGDKVSPAPWDLAVRQISPRYGQPRSRRPFVWREAQEGASWGEVRGDGSGDAGSELGLGESPVPGARGDRGAVRPRLALGEDSPCASPARSKPQHQRLRCRSNGTQEVVGGGRERGSPLRECRPDRSHTEGSEQPGSTLSIPRRSPRGWDGERSRSPGGSRDAWRSASDPESHSRCRKRKRNAADHRPRAGSEVGHQPVRLGQNGDSRPDPRSGNHQERVRHRRGIRGDPSLTRDPQRDRRGRLDIPPRANHPRDPPDPTERPEQAVRPNAENHPLAGEDKKKQAPHPLVVAQAHQPLADSRTHAPHPLVKGERPAHHPLPTKVKAKQVHFLLDDGEKVKPANWSMTSKHKQGQRPLEGKGKEICHPMAGRQMQARSPLAAEEKGKHVQIPLAVKGKDVQSPWAGKERKNPSHFPLANKGSPIQYRLGNKDTDTIIDYLLDKRKGGSSPRKHLSESSSPPFKGIRSEGTDAGKPLEASSTNRKLLPSLPAGDSRDGHTPPPRPGAEKDPASKRDWSKASPADPGGPRWREESTPRAAGGAEREIPRKLASGPRGESDWVRDHQDTAKDRLGRSRGNRNRTPSPRNQRNNRRRAGEQRVPEDRRKFPGDKSGNLRNGMSVPAWFSDETLKELQAMELRKARLQKVRRDEKRAQVVQDEEFALQLLRNEMMALRLDEAQTLPCRSQKAAHTPERENDEGHRSCSPCSLNVDWDEEVNIEKPAFF